MPLAEEAAATAAHQAAEVAEAARQAAAAAHQAEEAAGEVVVGGAARHDEVAGEGEEALDKHRPEETVLVVPHR